MSTQNHPSIPLFAYITKTHHTTYRASLYLFIALVFFLAITIFHFGIGLVLELDIGGAAGILWWRTWVVEDFEEDEQDGDEGSEVAMNRQGTIGEGVSRKREKWVRVKRALR